MASNDEVWSAFWARVNLRSNPPHKPYLYVDKHVGEDTDTTRGHEVIGYVVIEAGSDAFGDVAYRVGAGGDSVRGMTSGPALQLRDERTGRCGGGNRERGRDGREGWRVATTVRRRPGQCVATETGLRRGPDRGCGAWLQQHCEHSHVLWRALVSLVGLKCTGSVHPK